MRRTWPIFLVLLLIGWTGRHRIFPGLSTPNELLFAHTYTTGAEQKIIEGAVADFEKSHPGVRIRQIVQNSDTYQTVGWRILFNGERRPDVFFYWDGYRMEQAIAQGQILNLKPYLEAGFTEQFVPSFLHQRADGAIYYLPTSVDLSCLVFYNRTLFQELGLTEPATLEQWIEITRALSQAGKLPMIQGNRDLWPLGNFAAQLAAQDFGPERFRSAVLKQDAQSSAFAPFGSLHQLLEAHAMDGAGGIKREAVAGLGDLDASVLFLNGKAAQHVLGSWFLAGIKDSQEKKELKFEVGVFPIPPPANGHPASVVVSTGFLASRSTRQPALAAAFIQHLLSRKYQQQFAAIGAISARSDAMSFVDDPLAVRLYQLLAAVKTVVPPPDIGFPSELAFAFYRSAARVISGEATQEVAWREFQDYRQRMALK